eukprot:TRINITY_DN19172_c0_g2_i2.p2 TRINITY_DN19172_c0_g2~~TRINITY_DN19172_c0_g2_i2.p2  ORF type:complete len:143 (+),score=19.34 TRINITY_DN19172_c0_g2_i2:71-499(+)
MISTPRVNVTARVSVAAKPMTARNICVRAEKTPERVEKQYSKAEEEPARYVGERQGDSMGQKGDMLSKKAHEQRGIEGKESGVKEAGASPAEMEEALKNVKPNQARSMHCGPHHSYIDLWMHDGSIRGMTWSSPISFVFTVR